MECDFNAWHTPAIDSTGRYSCGARIEWIAFGAGISEKDACLRVGSEFPSECAACDPSRCTLREAPRCGCQSCEDSWDYDAGGHSCGLRITWLQTSSLAPEILTEEGACLRVGRDEFPDICSGCNPDVCDSVSRTTPIPVVTAPAAPAPGMHCDCEECNYDVWHTTALDSVGNYTCGSRIEWVSLGTGLSQEESCLHIASKEFPVECGACDPATCTRRGTPRCGCEACEAVWNVLAGDYTCGSRITWLQTSKLAGDLLSEEEACFRVSREEFPDQCFECDPNFCAPSMPAPAIPPTVSGYQPSSAPFSQPFMLTPSTTPGKPKFGGCDSDGVDLIGCTVAQTGLLPPQNLKESLIFTRAIPTNKWWTNMIGQAANPSTSPMYSHPFRLVFNHFLDRDFGLHVCYSSDYRVFLDNYVNGVPKGYFHESGSDMIFSAADFATAPHLEIVDWDDLGLGVTIELTADNGGVMSTKLVEGMAFLTAQYIGLVPRITTIHAILTVNGNNFDPINPVSYTGTKFVVTLSKGQKWVIYASETITLVSNVLTIDGVDSHSLVAPTFVNDVTLRVALLPEGVDEGIYDIYSRCIVAGGSLEIFSSSSYSIMWHTEGDCSNGLLHLGFPHHDDVLDQEGVTDTGVVLMSATRGAMRGWATPNGATTRWTMHEVDYIPVDGFFAPRGPDPSLIESFGVLGILEAEIAADFVLDGMSYYFTGKAAQKYATMCLLATDVIVNPSYPDDPSLANSCVAKLQAAFDTFLRNQLAYPLAYDKVFFGITSSEGFSENGGVYSDFGNTVYNDHHFHYGVS